MIHDCFADTPSLAVSPGNFSKTVSDISDDLYIFFYVGYLSEFKFPVTVGMTKGASIPWTIPRRPNKQTFRFTWRPYRPLFKRANLFHGVHSFLAIKKSSCQDTLPDICIPPHHT
jgi:hypothetical protein